MFGRLESRFARPSMLSYVFVFIFSRAASAVVRSWTVKYYEWNRSGVFRKTVPFRAGYAAGSSAVCRPLRSVVMRVAACIQRSPRWQESYSRQTSLLLLRSRTAHGIRQHVATAETVLQMLITSLPARLRVDITLQEIVEILSSLVLVSAQL